MARRRSVGDEAGFTLLEVIVGLVIFTIVAAALIPLLITGAVASKATTLSTEAKNLTSKRLDSMRSLPFHVSAQNGPFVDVLDEYFVNASTTPTSIPTTGGTGRYVASAVVPGQSAPSAYYVVTFSSSSNPDPLPTGFTQSVYTQFLSPNTQGGTTPTGDSVLAPPSAYNNNNPTASQTDSPPSFLIGVTVVTTYRLKGAPHSYNVFTEISDTGHDSPLVVASAGTEAIRVSAVAADGTALSAVVGEIGQDASLSNESAAYDSVVNASFTRTDPAGVVSYTPLVKGQASWTATPNATSGLSGTSTACGITDSGPNCSGGNCGWGWINPTSYTDVGATVANAQPRIPHDVESGGATQFAVSGAGVGGSCGAFSFSNAVPGSPSTDSGLIGFSNSTPIIGIPDGPASQQLVSGSARVDTPVLTFTSGGGIANPVTSSASVAFNTPIYLFPSTSFVNRSTLPDGSTSYGSLVAVKFTSAVSIACSSQSSNATVAYTGNIYVWQQATQSGSGSYRTIPFSFNSGSPTTLPAPSTVTVTWSSGNPVQLSSYLASWSTGNVVQQQPAGGATNTNVGVHTVPAAISMVTQNVLAGLTGTGVTVNLATVSCVSQDQR